MHPKHRTRGPPHWEQRAGPWHGVSLRAVHQSLPQLRRDGAHRAQATTWGHRGRPQDRQHRLHRGPARGSGPPQRLRLGVPCDRGIGVGHAQTWAPEHQLAAQGTLTHRFPQTLFPVRSRLPSQEKTKSKPSPSKIPKLTDENPTLCLNSFHPSCLQRPHGAQRGDCSCRRLRLVPAGLTWREEETLQSKYRPSPQSRSTCSRWSAAHSGPGRQLPCSPRTPGNERFGAIRGDAG